MGDPELVPDLDRGMRRLVRIHANQHHHHYLLVRQGWDATGALRMTKVLSPLSSHTAAREPPAGLALLEVARPPFVVPPCPPVYPLAGRMFAPQARSRSRRAGCETQPNLGGFLRQAWRAAVRREVPLASRREGTSSMSSARDVAKQVVCAAAHAFGLEVTSLHRFGMDADRDIAELLAGVVHPIVFDVGANIGQSVTRFRRLLPGCEIYSFEPAPETFRELQINTQGMPDVHIVNAGVGSSAAPRCS